MEIADLKKRIQEHLTDGLVTIVGSGLSVAEGIPGMRELATHLKVGVPDRIDIASAENWAAIERELDGGMDLESALLKHRPDDRLESVIGDLTAKFILQAETRVLEEVMANHKVLRFARLLKHLLKPNTGIPIITTNYDRLIEAAAEIAGLCVDGLFVGQLLGRLDAKASRYSLCRDLQQRRRSVELKYADHVLVLKPHGSLDWYRHNDEPIRCPVELSSQRLIITPGLNKFRGGYDRPFDAHRERANKEIDAAQRFLIIGYGFNDDHLQTHLEPRLRKGIPTILVTRELSERAKKVIEKSAGVTALCADASGTGTRVVTSESQHFFNGPALWDLNTLVSEVLEP